MDYNSAVTMSNIALGINLLMMVLVVTALLATFLVIRRQDFISKAAAAFPVALETITYSEIPISVVAVIADHMQIPLGDVIAEYSDDAEHRRSIVLKAFRKDRVTDNFIKRFQSKFIRNGYVGEDLLAASAQQQQ